MVHCPICYYTHSMTAWNLSCKCKPSLRYDAETKDQERVTSVPIWGFVGVISVFGCNNTHTHSHHPAQWCDLIMLPFRGSSHSKGYVSGRERPRLFGVIVLLFCTSCEQLIIFCDCVPTLTLDTCCSNLLSFTGRVYMLSLQQMSPSLPPWGSQSKQNLSSKTIAELNIRVREPVFAHSDKQEVGHHVDMSAKNISPCTEDKEKTCFFFNR